MKNSLLAEKPGLNFFFEADVTTKIEAHLSRLRSDDSISRSDTEKKKDL